MAAVASVAMSAFTRTTATTPGAGPLTAVVATLVLVAAAVRLLAIDVERWRIIQTDRGRTTAISSSGHLTGVTTAHTQWAVGAETDDDVLLFPVGAATARTDIGFWRAVLFATRRRGHEVQFVGVCDRGDACGTVQGNPAIPILSHMGPIQMHVAALARRGGRALLYHGPRLSASLAITADADDVAVAILRQLEKGAAR